MTSRDPSAVIDLFDRPSSWLRVRALPESDPCETASEPARGLIDGRVPVGRIALVVAPNGGSVLHGDVGSAGRLDFSATGLEVSLTSRCKA